LGLNPKYYFNETLKSWAIQANIGSQLAKR
jgi:hypothetical protein